MVSSAVAGSERGAWYIRKRLEHDGHLYLLMYDFSCKKREGNAENIELNGVPRAHKQLPATSHTVRLRDRGRWSDLMSGRPISVRTTVLPPPAGTREVWPLHRPRPNTLRAPPGRGARLTAAFVYFLTI